MIAIPINRGHSANQTHYAVISVLSNHLAEEMRASCFTSIVYQLSFGCPVAGSDFYLFLIVPYVGLLCVIVAFTVILSSFSCYQLNCLA